MTRINIIPVKELTNKHLLAEWREMPRVVKNLNKSLNRSNPFSKDEMPKTYTLGFGHIKFFYDKFLFLHKRHMELTKELLQRGYNLSYTDSNIFATVGKEWYNDYIPTEEEMAVNRQRSQDRLAKKLIRTNKTT